MTHMVQRAPVTQKEGSLRFARHTSTTIIDIIKRHFLEVVMARGGRKKRQKRSKENDYACFKVENITQLTFVIVYVPECLICWQKILRVLYSKKFSSAKNFVKSDRQAVRQEFIFVKRRVARFVFGRSVHLLIVYLHIHDYF